MLASTSPCWASMFHFKFVHRKCVSLCVSLMLCAFLSRSRHSSTPLLMLLPLILAFSCFVKILCLKSPTFHLFLLRGFSILVSPHCLYFWTNLNPSQLYVDTHTACSSNIFILIFGKFLVRLTWCIPRRPQRQTHIVARNVVSRFAGYSC